MRIVGNTRLDNRAGIIRAEGIENTDRDVLGTDRIDSRRINHFGTEVAELGSLYIAETLDGICIGYQSWVGGHKTVDIGPYF